MVPSPSSPTRPPPPRRPRMNSKDIPRTYSGLYGYGNDLLPFELARNSNTEWVANAGWQLLLTYISVIFMFLLVLLAFFPWNLVWTAVHTIHFFAGMVYMHWIKGSPNFYEQGEMNAMTFWEQLQSTQGTANAQRALLVVPTLLCYAACHFANYDFEISVWNIVLWAVAVLCKLPFMNGVRVLGINRTTGIDDDLKVK
uniref:ORM1-like protein 3 n=1 Tax=Cyclophora tenuis TaxID=216820 RepID=A0A6U1R7F7_CYCTE|mmetsp:Transcript_23615/g.40069  ORF Transcript_23615/g.40069 Transcript_23615/m.40069 type:complete len:198 (+) Transcript_23615:129-722(+)